MPVIEIEHPHSLGKTGCMAAIDAVVLDLSQRHGLTTMAWSGDTLGFAGHGVEGQLVAGEHVAHVRVRLGGMAAFIRPAIEAEIRRRLHQHLG